jgi:hypothetical protein
MKLKMMALATVAAAAFALPAMAATELTLGYGGGDCTTDSSGTCSLSLVGIQTDISAFSSVAPTYARFLEVHFNATQRPQAVPVVTNLANRTPTGVASILVTILRNGVNFASRTLVVGPTGITTDPMRIATNDSATYQMRITLQSSARNPAGQYVEGFAAVTTVVPEPSTWMLMIMGFGLIASQLRRRYREGLASAA